MFLGHLRGSVAAINDAAIDFILAIEEAEVKRRRSFDDALMCVCRAIIH